MPLKKIQNKKLLLEISPEMGCSITKFIDLEQEKEIFRTFPKHKKINKYNCYFSGYFATVPYFGAIHKKTFLYKDKYINLPNTHPLEPMTIHGEGWVNKWRLIKSSNSSLTLEFKHNGKKSFPYKYSVSQMFKIKKASLEIRIKIKNLDSENFNCGIGFHPWFSLSKDSKIYSNSFNYLHSKKNKFTIKKLIKTKALDINKTKIDETFLNWNGKSKLILNKDIQIEIRNKKNIKNLHVYSPPKENFFCIEPVSNVRDAYLVKKNSKLYNGLKIIRPKKSFEAAVEFKILN